jgi:hypothetical protein
MLIVVAAGEVAALGAKTVSSDSTIRPDRMVDDPSISNPVEAVTLRSSSGLGR